MMNTIPELEYHCGSWIAINRATGEAVAEIFERRNAERLNFDKYELQTAAQWLGTLNRVDQIMEGEI